MPAAGSRQQKVLERAFEGTVLKQAGAGESSLRRSASRAPAPAAARRPAADDRPMGEPVCRSMAPQMTAPQMTGPWVDGTAIDHEAAATAAAARVFGGRQPDVFGEEAPTRVTSPPREFANTAAGHAAAVDARMVKASEAGRRARRLPRHSDGRFDARRLRSPPDAVEPVRRRTRTRRRAAHGEGGRRDGRRRAAASRRSSAPRGRRVPSPRRR